MANENEALQTVSSKLVAVEAELAILAKSEGVKRYLELSKNAKALTRKTAKLYLKSEEIKMFSCTHIWVKSAIEYKFDGHRDNREEYFSCVKCGLDTQAEVRAYSRKFPIGLAYVMNSVLKDQKESIESDIVCNFTLAKGIYNSVVRAHPGIDDELAVGYIRGVLTNIRTGVLSDEEKQEIVQRLGLHPKFNSWNSSDIVRDI